MDPSDSEDLSVWQDVLDQVMAGRTKGHTCPHCGKAEVDAEIDEYQTFLKVACPGCGKYVEGQLT